MKLSKAALCPTRGGLPAKTFSEYYWDGTRPDRNPARTHLKSEARILTPLLHISDEFGAHRGHYTPIDQTGWNTKKHPGFRILLCFGIVRGTGVCRTCSEVGHLMVARGRYWVGIIATAEVQCSTRGLSAWRRGKHNLSLLYY